MVKRAVSTPLRSQTDRVASLGVGPYVGGGGRRIRCAVFIDLGVHYRQSLGDGSTSASVMSTSPSVITGSSSTSVTMESTWFSFDLGVLVCVAAFDHNFNGDAEHPIVVHGVVEVQLRVGAELSPRSVRNVAADSDLTQAVRFTANGKYCCVGPLQ